MSIPCFWLEPTRKKRDGATLWKRGDTGATLLLRDAPPGAMWHAHWMGDRYQAEDGLYLVVMTPGGAWLLDGARPDGGRWARVGEPPFLTVDPGVHLAAIEGRPGFTGHLRAGLLEPEGDP